MVGAAVVVVVVVGFGGVTLPEALGQRGSSEPGGQITVALEAKADALPVYGRRVPLGF